MQTPLTVTTLNNQIKSLLETHYLHLSVIGEVSRVTYHASGHLYFSLKDANSSISCVMFKGNNQRLKFRLEEGMEIIATGGISVYTPRGSYQINCLTLEPSGSGALALAFEQLKERLRQKGYFEASRKKALPKFPSRIAVITSKTGAAIEDMKRVAQKRWPLAQIILFDTIVQGESAAGSIADNIQKADKIGADIIVVGRGGGSLEDLWAFNEEIVADAIYHAHTPVVSAVGHEIDTLISDYCADLRAPTPSAAMELILPDINEMRLTLDGMLQHYQESFLRLLTHKAQQLSHLRNSFEQHSFDRRLAHYQEELKSLKDRYQSALALFLNQKERTLQNLKELYAQNDPAKRDKIGFAQVVKNGKKIALEQIKIGEKITLLNSKVKLEAKVEGRKEI